MDTCVCPQSRLTLRLHGLEPARPSVPQHQILSHAQCPDHTRNMPSPSFKGFPFFPVHVRIFIPVLRAQQQPSPATSLDCGFKRTRAAQSPGSTSGKRQSFVTLSPSAGRICRCSHSSLEQPTGRFPVRVGGLSLSHRETAQCFKK